MKITKQHLAYFSATNSTRDLVRKIGQKINLPITQEHNMAGRAKAEEEEVAVSDSELLVVGVPSYFGRVPSLVVPYLNKFKGDNSPAIVLCTYGNRDFDDTLLELKDLLSANGFRVIASGAFVASHSIFPQVAADRPNENDRKEQDGFAEHCVDILNNLPNTAAVLPLVVRGKHPYRAIGKIPLRPTGNRKCDKCGTCVKLCPASAIPADKPKRTDKDKCIACGRCITVCPQHARAYRGIIYRIARSKFVKAHQAVQPNVLSYIE